MQRVTITIDDDLAEEFDRFTSARGYQSRSEAIRDLARAGLRQVGHETAHRGTCVAALVYVYDHHVRALSKRLAETHHEHHDLSLATMHVHLDHHSCLEVSLLRGATGDVRHLADHVIAERGVRHGQLVIVPVEMSKDTHSHGGHAHEHSHTRVREGGSD